MLEVGGRDAVGVGQRGRGCLDKALDGNGGVSSHRQAGGSPGLSSVWM